MPRVALITGASRGIGAETARLLAERGFQVVVNYRSSAEEAEEVVADITAAGGDAVIPDISVTHEDQIPVREDLLELFQVSELEKYFTAEELADHPGRRSE